MLDITWMGDGLQPQTGEKLALPTFWLRKHNGRAVVAQIHFAKLRMGKVLKRRSVVPLPENSGCKIILIYFQMKNGVSTAANISQ